MKEIFVETITIGDEILYGQTLDTNSHWISQEMNAIGAKVIRKTTIGDERQQILNALPEAAGRADIILITGGLGPTKDDITKKTLAEYFDSPIEVNPQALKEVAAYFESLGRIMSGLNIAQTELPVKCQMLSNTVGTAPGMWFEKDEKVYISMPGVPHEMKTMMIERVIPRLKVKFDLPVIRHRMIKTVGIGESLLAEIIDQWEDNLPQHIRLAYLPDLGEVKLRLTAVGDQYEKLEQDIEAQIQTLLPLIGDYVYGFGSTSLEEAIGNLLLEQQKTIALAESCTGGYIAHLITRIPGSSRYFQGGMVPYQNEMKINVLGVERGTIAEHGAVSEATIVQMANRIRECMQADIGLASSGIAGPDGGTDEKPVGTVWIAVADGEQTLTKKLQLTKNRLLNIELTAVAVLNMLRKSLKP
jgi:nicotinamide-nucleotide amidase